MTSKPLWEETRDLHHACEHHPVGSAMASGEPPRIWYAAWLNALNQIHNAIDPHCDEVIRRTNNLQEDIQSIGRKAILTQSAKDYVETLTDDKKIDGAIYVLTGAHLMGGEIMKKRLVGYPTKHLEWEDRRQAISILQQYRIRDDITEEARDCFKALLNIMDEIELTYPIN